jgi:hypothetical protein
MKKSDDSGILSIDFLVGFTIFIIAFIWVVSMIPGLLIGLQAYTIDYDAVAYRTGVILVEDPGYPDYLDRNNLAWEEKLKNDKRDVIRLGLALSKDTPNILSQEKVKGFYCTSASYSATAFTYGLGDYQKRAIFGDYPYRFNITLRDLDRNTTQSVGDVIPLNSSYGYTRRLVRIKENSNATFNETNYNSGLGYKNTQNASTHTFSILLNTTRLVSGEVINPAYQINPVRELIVINLTDLNKTTNQLIPPVIKLSNLKITRTGDLNVYPFLDSLYVDGNSIPTPQSGLPVTVNSSVSLKFKPTFFDTIMKDAEGSQIYINLTFKLEDNTGVPKNSTFLNNSWGRPFEYNYTQINVGPPQLHPGILEVAVW